MIRKAIADEVGRLRLAQVTAQAAAAQETTGTSHQEEVTEDRYGLKALIESPRWQHLEPNFPNPNHLLPRELTKEELEAIVDAIASQDPKALREAKAFEAKLSGGSLRKIGDGESKTAFRYKRPDMKSLIIHDQAGYNFGVTIPPESQISFGYYDMLDDRMVKINGYYSGARTYIQIPLPPKDAVGRGITLQENLGQDIEGDGIIDQLRGEKK